MLKPSRIVVLGNACLDTAFHLSRMPRPGETLLAKQTAQDLGGKGLLQAIAARRAGAEVVMIAAVGNDIIAERIQNTLASEQISTDTLIVKDGLSDHSTILLDESGENCIVSDMLQAQAMSTEDFMLHLSLTRRDILLLQGNLSRSATISAIAQANRDGAFVAVNLAPIQAWLPDLPGKVDVAIANASEAMEFTNEKTPEQAIAALDVPIVIVTLGRNGCLVRQTSEPMFKIAAPAIESRDSTGAGDVFVGTFVSEWLLSKDVTAAAKLAVHAASDMTTRFGTVSAMPHRTTIDKLRSKLRNLA